MIPKAVVHSDPEVLGGTPVFVGTRVPVQSLFDYLEGGETDETKAITRVAREYPANSRLTQGCFVRSQRPEQGEFECQLLMR